MSDNIKEILEEKLGLKDKTYSEQVVAIQKKINAFKLCADSLQNYYENDFKLEELEAKFKPYCDELVYPAGRKNCEYKRDFRVCLVKVVRYNNVNLYRIYTNFYFYPENPYYRLELRIAKYDDSWGFCNDFSIKSDIVKEMIPQDYKSHIVNKRCYYFKDFKRSEYNDESILAEIKKLSDKIDDFIENHPEITRRC